MVRTPRTWSEIRAEIRQTLRETDANVSFWTDAELQYLVNQERDRLSMILQEAHEGHDVLPYTTNIVADQAEYQLPSYANRVIRVLRVYDDGRELPLERSEDWSELLPATADTGADSVPTYRIIGEHIFLNPTPAVAVTNGLKIEIEVGRDRITADSDQVIPVGWPLFAETWLVLSTAIAAFDVEGAQGPMPEGIYSSLLRRRETYEELLNEYVETRSFGRNYSTPFIQAD